MSDLKVPDDCSMPEWFYEIDNLSKSEAANKLISGGFWKTVNIIAHDQTLTEMKKLAEWNIDLPPNQQEEGVYLQYLHMVTAHQNQLVSTAKTDEFVRNRLLAQATEKAFVAVDKMIEASEPIQTHLVLFLKENGLFQYLELDGIIEFLRSKKSPQKEGGRVPGNNYEIEFMVEYMIPIMEANGFSREIILDIADNFGKSRLALPYIKDVLSEDLAKQREIRDAMTVCKDPEERIQLEELLQESLKVSPKMRKTLTTLFDEMGKSYDDGGLSRRQFKRKLQDIAATRKTVDKALGYKYLFPRGGIISISCNDQRMLAAIENMLSSLVDMHLGEPEDMIRQVTELTFGDNE